MLSYTSEDTIRKYFDADDWEDFDYDYRPKGEKPCTSPASQKKTSALP